jgi:hypothetical protein
MWTCVYLSALQISRVNLCILQLEHAHLYQNTTMDPVQTTHTTILQVFLKNNIVKC